MSEDEALVMIVTCLVAASLLSLCMALFLQLIIEERGDE